MTTIDRAKSLSFDVSALSHVIAMLNAKQEESATSPFLADINKSIETVITMLKKDRNEAKEKLYKALEEL